MHVTRSVSRRRPNLLAGVVASLLLTSGLLAAPAPAVTPCTSPPATFPTSQMTPGMTGTGYTVIKGQTVQSFDVQILGVIPDYFFLGVDAIVVEMTGPQAFLNTTGGIVAGMSGSPVYFNGKLGGAVSYGIAGDRHIFGLTAAEDMVGIFSLQDGGTSAIPVEVALTDGVRRAIARATDMPLASTATSMQALPVPLAISGTGGRSLKEIKAVFADHGIAVRPFRSGSTSAPTTATLDPSPLLPGEGLGVALSYGDVTWGGIGTVTATCGSSVLGFGHPMFYVAAGPVSLGMNEVNVLGIDNGTFWGYKIATLGEAHGALTQDRFAGVLGVLGVMPDTVGVTSDVSSPDTELSRVGRTDITWDEGWAVAEIAFAHAYANLTHVAQADGPGTLAFAWTIEGTRGDGSTFTVSNRTMEFSDWSAAYGAWRMSDMLYALVYNSFEKVGFTSVDMSGEITADDLRSEIARIRLSSPVQPALRERGTVKAAPGDKVTVEVTFDPVGRTSNEVFTFALKVPRGTRGDQKVRLAGGRGRIDYWDVGSFDEMIAAMNDGDHQNDLIVSGLGPTAVYPQDVIVQGKSGFSVQVVR